jgi:hypothetical protein
MKHISTKDLATRWNCHWTTINLRARKGDLTPIKIGRKHYFSLEQVKLLEEVAPIAARVKKAKKPKRQTVLEKETYVEDRLPDRIFKFIRNLFCK